MSLPPKLASLLAGTGLDTDWDTSRATYPGKPLAFLQPDAIRETGWWANLPSDAIDFLIRAAAHIADDSDLSRLAWHAHRLLFVTPGFDRGATRGWPLLAPVLGEFGNAFYLLIILSGIPRVRAFHQSRGVPDDIARLTYRDTCVWAKQYFEIGVSQGGRFFHPGAPGSWGLCTRILPWLLSHLNGDLYRVGRLQFKVGPFRSRMRAYRHRQTGHMRLLAEAGLAFRTDGNYDGAGGITDPHAWMSEHAENSDTVTATPIHPNGHAQRTPITLPLSQWECVLKEGDPILEIHIPEDGPMAFDACGESLRQASTFFPKHFPDRPFKAFCCTSWILDPTYQALLSERSNLVRFQRECYLFPLHSRGGRSGLERIFGPHTHDLSTAPRDTAMRAAVLDHLNGGGVLISGGCLLWPEHLDRWGTRIYQSQFSNA